MKIMDLLSFSNFYNQIKNEKINFQLAYKIEKLKREVDFHLNFYEENLNSLILQYADKEEDGELKKTNDGQGIAIQKGKEKECEEKINELINLEIEKPNISFSLDEFNSIQLSIENLKAIMPFINE